MKVRRLGYACINTELNTSKPRVSTSRTIRKDTYLREGLVKTGELSLQNLKDLLTILKWNLNHGVKLFRLSSDIFPWKSEWEFEDMPEWEIALGLLKEAGDFAKKNDMRLTFHPGPFNKLCSSDERIINNTIRELEEHSEIFDLMGFEPSYENTINIHLGASYNNKEATATVWCKNYEKLSDNLKKRLTIENDDKAALYDTEELYKWVYKEINVPIMFDFHHHDCYYAGTQSEKDIVELAISTWPDHITPLFHWSESRRKEQNDFKLHAAAHSDLCYGPLPSYDLSKEVDLMIEAKLKEQSIPLLKYADGSPVHKIEV